MDSNLDKNKIIPIINDCRGTCKTAIGCTCRDSDIDDGQETVVVGTEVVTDRKLGIVMVEPEKKKKSCCGGSGGCGCSSKENGSCCPGRNKLEVYDWLRDIPAAQLDTQMVEVQFKNTRKGYFLNSNNLEVNKGDIIAVEATPGHDIGEITLTGKLVQLQMKKNNFRGEVKRVYRIAKPNDIEKYNEAKGKEHKTMLRAREMAENLQLDMKISDVEYQGDGNKAIFYYIADGRVDFRQLIKDYASEFRIKIEMKQIGARQEAGRVGGIGPCGRELCCSSSMSNFVSVSTSAARLQDIPLNPQKLAGQCGKLKCCLNFEVDTYVEAQRTLPPRDMILETKDSSYFLFKVDILSGQMTYSTDKYIAANLITVSKDRVFDIIKMNKGGKRPLNLNIEEEQESKPTSFDVLDQESINRFDTERKNKRKKKKRKDPRDEESASVEGTPRVNNIARPKQTEGLVVKKEFRPNNKPENAEKSTDPERNRPRNDNRPKRKNGNNRPQRNNNEKPENQKPEE